MVDLPPVGPERDLLVAEAMGCTVIEQKCRCQVAVTGMRYHSPKHTDWDTGQFHRFSSDDATFVRECIPWLRAKRKPVVIIVGKTYSSIRMAGVEIERVVVAGSIADAGTAFILMAKEAGVI